MAENLKDFYLSNGHPSQGGYFANLGAGKYCFDYVNRKWYKYLSGSWQLSTNLPTDSSQGNVIVPTITVGTTTTLPAGSPATVTDRDSGQNVVLDFGIPQGPKGDPGTSTGTGPGAALPFIFVQPNGVDDTAAIQAAVDTAYTTMQTIWLAGKYKFSSGVKIKKDHRYLTIMGWAELEATNTGNWAFFYSDAPVDTAEAEGIMAFRKVKFANLIFKGTKTQTGIDIFATEGAEYSYIWGYDLKTSLNLTFSLRSTVQSCEANCCVDGIIVQSGVGRWADADTSNSCSNGTRLISPRMVGDKTASKIGLWIKDASDVEVNNPIVEGHYFSIAGIRWDCMSPTSTGVNIFMPHFECATPCKFLIIRSSTMSHQIIDPNWIKPGIYVETEVTGGYPQVNIRDISNQRMYFNGTPVFNHGAGTSWKFSNCDNPINTTDVPKMFNGLVSQGCGSGAGANKWCIENPVNR